MKHAFLFIALTSACAGTQDRPATNRPAAPWPPPAGPLKLIVDTDAANEIDDQYALALLLGFPERLKLEGLVAAHFGKHGGPEGVEKSFREILEVLKRAGLEGKVPVRKGLQPLDRPEWPSTTEGVDFIVERARAATPESPLWLVLLGPVTDAVAALRKDPSIADRLVVFWHGRSSWPKKCTNFNAENDRTASRLVFEMPCRLVLFDTGAHLRMSAEETARRFGPLGPLGAYLQEIRSRKKEFMSEKKGIFDLGDIAALIDPSCAPGERVQAPSVREDMSYDFSRLNGEIVRIPDVGRDRSFDLLEESLRRISSGR
jgi:inosine-uridine nucleoside N-ribohydrolase